MRNKLYVISGCSGSGKSSTMKTVMDNELVSFTTRKPREGEVNGKDYIFITEEEFQNLLHNDGLIEHVEYAGNKYGLTKNELETKLSKGSAFWIADFNGMKQMKKLYDNVTTIFFFAEKEDAEKRMRQRGDSEENIQKRLSTYEEEIENLLYYDEVINTSTNTFEEVVEIVKDIIELECENETTISC